jgi:hypothetical protein
MQLSRRNGMLFLSVVLFHIGPLNAQSPVFTDTAFAPQAGDQYTVNNAQYISPGFAGANQTWDFSPAILNGTATYLVTDVGAIPCGNQYPTATLGIGINGYEMIHRTWNEYNVVGTTITPGQANFVYSDPEKRFKFPMNFNTTYTDLYYGISTVAQTTYRSGFVLVSCDAFGTVITPTATYTNALRFHRTAMWTDSSATGGDTCTGEYYYWFAPGNRYPVAQIWSVTCTGGSSTGAMFLDSITIGVDEMQNPAASLNVFPNPFATSFTLSSTQDCVGQTATILDISGRTVKQFIITSPDMTVEPGEIENGIYFLVTDNKAVIRLLKTESEE